VSYRFPKKSGSTRIYRDVTPKLRDIAGCLAGHKWLIL
jgi:hypothetical protein